MLKRPVTNRGSILLGEITVILMALEFAQSKQRKRKNHGITIFSDSQSAVGILTLGWTATSQKSCKVSVPTKSYISAAKCPRLANLEPN